jgi:AcrR family transcriptional regulator
MLDARRTLTKATATKRVQPAAEESNARRQEILLVASDLFARRGYDAVGVRQIADAAGILGGSLYHHFPSKRDLYVEVHSAALAGAASRMEAEIAELNDPWERLEAACRVHLAVQVDPESVTLPMMSDISAMSSDMREDLVKARDRFEVIYKRLIADLPLNASIDRSIYRLSLVSLINAVPMWYRTGRLSVAEIAAQIVTIFRASAGPAPKAKPVKLAKAKKKAAR